MLNPKALSLTPLPSGVRVILTYALPSVRERLAAPNLHPHISGFTNQTLLTLLGNSGPGPGAGGWGRSSLASLCHMLLPGGWGPCAMTDRPSRVAKVGEKARCCCQTQGKVMLTWPQSTTTTGGSISGSLRKRDAESSNVSVYHWCLRFD